MCSGFLGQIGKLGMEVRLNKLHPKHLTRTYKVIFKAHPLVVRLCWLLRRWVRITPWIEATYPDDGDPLFFNGAMFVGERHWKLLQRITS